MRTIWLYKCPPARFLILMHLSQSSLAVFDRVRPVAAVVGYVTARKPRKERQRRSRAAVSFGYLLWSPGKRVISVIDGRSVRAADAAMHMVLIRQDVLGRTVYCLKCLRGPWTWRKAPFTLDLDKKSIVHLETYLRYRAWRTEIKGCSSTIVRGLLL